MLGFRRYRGIAPEEILQEQKLIIYLVSARLVPTKALLPLLPAHTRGFPSVGFNADSFPLVPLEVLSLSFGVFSSFLVTLCGPDRSLCLEYRNACVLLRSREESSSVFSCRRS